MSHTQIGLCVGVCVYVCASSTCTNTTHTCTLLSVCACVCVCVCVCVGCARVRVFVCVLLPGGGGAPPLWKVIGTCRWTGYDFAGHQYWHRVSNRPNVVITIGTGYQIGLMWSSPLTQGIKIGLLGYGRLLRLSQDRMPIVFYDRPAIQAEAMIFFFFFCLSAQHPQLDRVYPRSTILQQGMHLNVFSKVYCDRVYFSCAERNMTGSGFDPPPQRHPPIQLRNRVPPPPPPGVLLSNKYHSK